ncbi:hypothetical protein [Pedobacter cryoconitis]|uniref:Uncharacterized protein n=1 Tax=Pedobacter cryoconitis TaxID=188932 RepID=A0A7X0J2S8_9SPHI|nr:hypothetical protein [Pedobacter cryoconitis]MBB6499644.1 hypothetical protein [Pedobacter cryoconitis]
MKKILLTLAIIIAGYSTYAQYLPLTAGSNYPLTGTLFSNNVEAIRLSGNNVYLSAFDYVNVLRTGYLQFNPGGSIILGADNASSIALTGANVGIGTINPQGKFDVYDGNGTNVIAYFGANNIINAKGLYLSRPTVNTNPVNIQGSQVGVGRTDISLQAEGGNVGIGTSNPQGHKLAVNGDIIATSVIVKLYGNWPDYVFKPTYHLPLLTEVKAYIDHNQRLPDMPSEQEVTKEGINLGEIVKLQTKKIEELTLYLIEKEQQINEINEKQRTQDAKDQKLQEQLKTMQDQLNNIMNPKTKAE